MKIIFLIFTVLMIISFIGILWNGLKYASSCCMYHVKPLKNRMLFFGSLMIFSLLFLVISKLMMEPTKFLVFVETYKEQIIIIFKIVLSFLIGLFLLMFVYFSYGYIVTNCEPKVIEQRKIRVIYSSVGLFSFIIIYIIFQLSIK